jgi:hypothetical protein
MRRKAYLQLAVYTLWGLLSVQSVLAAPLKNPARGKLDQVGKQANFVTKGVDENTIFQEIGEMVTDTGTYILGPLLMLYMLYGGFLWMNAAGDSGQIKTAKDIMRNAVIGLLILATALAVVSFVSAFLTFGSIGADGVKKEQNAVDQEVQDLLNNGVF